MKIQHLLPLLCVLTGATRSYSQSGKDSIVKNIRQVFQEINAEKAALRTISLDAQEFLGEDVNPDNGAELRGYFKGDTLCKMEIYIGLSFAVRRYNYYFSNSRIIFVYETERDFQQDSEGMMKYDTTLLAFEGRYYYDNGKLIQSLFKGRKRIDDNTPSGYIKELPDDTEKYARLLYARAKAKK